MKRLLTSVMRTKICFVLSVGFVFTLAAPAFAFGPYVHYAIMNKAHDKLVAEYPDIPVIWTVGSLQDQLEADRKGISHGCDVDLNAGVLNGNLSDLVYHEFTNIKSGFVRYVNGEDQVDISKHIRRLCHYIADGMSIGQISGPSLWGWKDDLIDLACEAVSNKRAWPSYVRDWGPGHFADGLNEFEDSVLETYATYRKDAGKWFGRFPFFPTSNDVTHMTRRGVAEASTLTSSFILLAWTDATSLVVENSSFEDGLFFWKAYGDGGVETTTQDAVEGSYTAHIERHAATGHYFGLYQEDIIVESDTEYRLSLWVRTNATSGSAAAALGVWSADPAFNHHTDFGHISGTTEWVHITGIWKSGPDENVIRVMLYGTPDFVGDAWFDDLVLEKVKPQNTGFESGLVHWEGYGDGCIYRAVGGSAEGAHCANLARDRATGNYFGLVKTDIPCEPNTTYRLTLWIKTEANSGSAAAALGNWGSPNTHADFGWTSGYTDWTQISGTWTSRWDETSMDIVLYGSTDFSGNAFFDGLVLEKVGQVPLGVNIHGPSSLRYKETGTYTAAVSQGSGDYRYH